MIGASHGGMLTLEYALAHPDRLYGAITGDAAAQWSHWAAMNAIKTALTDPRVSPDPEQLVRALSGNNLSFEDMAAAAQSIYPLYSVPDHLKGETEGDVNAVLAKATLPVWLPDGNLTHVKADHAKSVIGV
jgi:pimeloyl-ACP methyl ester carboxylesterase